MQQRRSALYSSGQFAPLLITSYRNRRRPPLKSCFFWTVPRFSNIRWLIKGLVHLCPRLYGTLHTDSPIRSTNPWISPLLSQVHLVTNRRVPVAPFQLVPAPHCMPLFVQDGMWQPVCVCGFWYNFFKKSHLTSNKYTDELHAHIKGKTHKERWMIYVFIYAIYFFFQIQV